MKSEPEEIDAEDHDEVLDRVAAIDVAKASGKVCTRFQRGGPGQAGHQSLDVASTTNAIIELADQLAVLGIERVVVESTSDYWRPFVYLLQARGLRVWLVNATQVKNVPGRPNWYIVPAVIRGFLRARSFWMLSQWCILYSRFAKFRNAAAFTLSPAFSARLSSRAKRGLLSKKKESPADAMASKTTLRRRQALFQVDIQTAEFLQSLTFFFLLAAGLRDSRKPQDIWGCSM